MGDDACVELVGFLVAEPERVRKGTAERRGALPVFLSERPRSAITQTQPNHLTCARLDRHAVMGCGLRPFMLRVYGIPLAVDNVVVDAVLDIRTAIGNAEDALRVSFVFREQKCRIAVAIQDSALLVGDGRP